jgi:hypothetical protein
MVLPYWFWLFTASAGVLAIAISAFVVTYMKMSELEAAERKKR